MPSRIKACALSVLIVGFTILFLVKCQSPFGDVQVLKDSTPYVGCYGNKGIIELILDKNMVYLTKSGQRQSITNYVRPKIKDEIELEKEIVYNIKLNQLRMTSRKSGFYYQFRKNNSTISLMFFAENSAEPYSVTKMDCGA